VAGESDAKKRYIPADQAQVLLLDRLLGEIRSVGARLKQQEPEGVVEPLATKHVTTQRMVIHPPQLDKNWFSVSVVSDGPNDCMIVVNTEKSATTPYRLRMNETFEVDMGSAKIVDLLCYCDVGTADLRIRGVR
jgi:hypothetical protein